jgi:predicted nucleotide-binding protein
LFLGKLGRARVCALYKEDVEIPSDYQGVIFTAMDDAGAWKLTLAREVRQAGIDVDMNKAL